MNRKVLFPTLFIIIVIVGNGAYYLTAPPPTPSSESPEEPPQIIGHTAYLDKVTERITFFTVVGVVQNNLRTNIESVNVTATFYDSVNYLIGTRYSPIIVDILEPEQRSPFAIYMLVEPTTALTDISYELTLEYSKTSKEPITGLIILNPTSSIDQDGYYIISGEIQNRGLRKAYSVVLYCIYYDSEDNFVSMSRAFIAPEMDLGDQASFILSSKPQKISPTRYELLIIPHHYGLLFVAHLTLLLILVIGFVLFIIYMRRRGW